MNEAQSKLAGFLAKKKEQMIKEGKMENTAKSTAADNSTNDKAVKPEDKTKQPIKEAPAKPTKEASAKPPSSSAMAQTFVKYADIKYMPKLTAAQKEAMGKFKVRRDLAINLKSSEAKDELAVLLKPTVLSTDQLFEFARKYGVEDAEIKRWKKTPNPGTLRMALGNRLRHLIVQSITK